MDISIARTFLEVVKTGSFVNAAANLNISQTAVSARIRVLEEQLDRPMFVRNKAGARLTPAGEQFFRFCNEPSASMGGGANHGRFAPGTRGHGDDRC